MVAINEILRWGRDSIRMGNLHVWGFLLCRKGMEKSWIVW